MRKKMGVNSKAEVAKSRKKAAEAEQKDRQTRDKEEQYWREAEGPKSKAAKKREEEAEKAESAAKKSDARRLAEQEDKELELKRVNRVSSPAVPKVTEAELVQRREEEQGKKSEEAKKRQTRVAGEEEYEEMVSVSNTNRDDSLIEARTVDEALAKMTEKRIKASFKVYLSYLFFLLSGPSQIIYGPCSKNTNDMFNDVIE